MSMPRRTEEVVVWDTRLSLRTAAKVELILLDPMTGHAKQGVRTKLIEQLLINWLQSVVQANAIEPTDETQRNLLPKE